MGESFDVWEERITDLLPYRVTEKLMSAARADAVFMHCLPAFHDLKTGIGSEIGQKFGLDCLEVENAVFESEKIYCIQRSRKQNAYNKSRYGGDCLNYEEKDISYLKITRSSRALPSEPIRTVSASSSLPRACAAI